MQDVVDAETLQRMQVSRRPDGQLILTTPELLGPYPEVLTDRLMHWAEVAPERLFIAQRDAAGDWAGVSYGEAARRVRRLGQALLDRGLSAERPVAILSGNSVNHALLALAGQYVGAPAAAIAPAYSLVSTDFSKLKHVFSVLTPGLVFVEDAAPFARALAATVGDEVEIVAVRGSLEGRGLTAFDALLDTAESPDVDAARARQSPDDVAKFLFTSGSTGTPKAVPNTHRMLCANQQMLRQVFPFVGETPPVFLDWLPWNHTFGGNQNLGMIVYNGGTFYIDDGRPTERDILKTVENLREISPTIYFSVPKGYEALLPHLRDDRALAERFFQARVIFYAGAALPESVWEGYPVLARAVTGRAPPLITSLGATETAPCSIAARQPALTPGEIGVPNPGLEAKLIPVGDKLELRLRGPNVMPGYWRDPIRTADAFDEEGFYKIGDAVTFIDPDRPDRGLRFDGRIAEDFKLSSGVWVNVASVRLNTLKRFAPLVRDIVIAGADRGDIRSLLFVDETACLRAIDSQGPFDPRDRAFRALLAERLASGAKEATGSSTCLAAVSVLTEPPSLDAGEITDKGTLNGRLILSRRPEVLEALYRDDDPDTVAL